MPVAKTLLQQFAHLLVERTCGTRMEGTRAAEIFIRSNGLDGATPDSVRKTAMRLGVGDQVARRFCARLNAKAIPWIALNPAYAQFRECLAAANEAILATAPGSASNISVALRTVRIDPYLVLGALEDAASLVRLCSLLGLVDTVRIEVWNTTVAIVPAGTPPCFPTILVLAKKIARISGAVNVTHLVNRLAIAYPGVTSPTIVDVMLAASANLLVEDSGESPGCRWYTFDSSANQAVARARARVGSFGHCSLQRLCASDYGKQGREGTRYQVISLSQYFIPLPFHIMVLLLRNHGFQVRGDRVSLKVVSVKHRSSAIQEQMVSLLREMGQLGPVRSTNFVASCVAAGLSAETVHAYMKRSGLFNCRRGVCRLA